MASSDQHASGSTTLFRFVAIIVLFLSVTASGLQVLGGLSALQHPDPNAPVPIPTLFIPAILSLIAGVALSTLLEGIARLVSARTVQSEDDTAPQVNLMMTIAELQNSLPGLIGEAVQQAVAQIQAPVQESAIAPADPNLQQHLERMVKLLEEMKELSMLDENQRQTRRMQVVLRRKSSRLDEVTDLIQQRNWVQADALLHLLESLHPGDADVLACRNRMDDARILHQADDWDRLTQLVNDRLALSQYTQATDEIKKFLDQFPAHADAQQLLQRVRQEERAYTESVTGRMYDQIKLAVENHQWRAALDGIQQFLDQYPDHYRSEKIRKQIRVIQKNAEIEERHEQEDRIKELINTRRFSEAAELSEDLLARFPESPQAAYLADLLPKLREKSTESEDAITQ